MTNTRIMDPEVLETRYPVRLERFAIRQGSGGLGQWKGGEAGEKGRNLRKSAECQRAEVPGATSYTAEAGEELIIETLGGGGWENNGPG